MYCTTKTLCIFNYYVLVGFTVCGSVILNARLHRKKKSQGRIAGDESVGKKVGVIIMRGLE